MRETWKDWKRVVFFFILALVAAVLLSSLADGTSKVWHDEIINGNSTVTMKNMENGQVVIFNVRFNGIGELSRIDAIGSLTSYWAPSFGSTDSWFKYWNPIAGMRFETRFYVYTVELRHTDDWVIAQVEKAP